ncbi:DUF3786 domain-containing protein [Desulforhopalus sp. IMCC35007]|uniref:DUF3786 domain-containing protein n=1 Tax=Desulforhopalus sp. IMCC35007 TaxID=2569543 RepID=UPI0010ADF028|nr:DUF3786 domain-containing protein [Desulforhopalus sp. IMCC35007]TKB10047.1 DUF3786 domain-containing protein [Desulforhopalus sp. IMCC35007]
MTEFIANIHFQALAEKDPQDVCRRTGCHYNVADACYSLPVWGSTCTIYPHSSVIHYREQKDQLFHEYFSLFAMHYLLGAKNIEISGKWVSEKDFAGGTTFFRGPHEIPTHLISQKYLNTVSGFVKRCELLRGGPLDMADAAYCFKITSGIPVAVLYWAGDEDFPAESKILYDSTIVEHLALDIVYALAVGICHRLAG